MDYDGVDREGEERLVSGRILDFDSELDWMDGGISLLISFGRGMGCVVDILCL